MSEQIEFNEKGNVIEILYEDDRPPFDRKLMGILQKDDEGFYRFHPSRNAVMIQKHFRIVGDKISELNR